MQPVVFLPAGAQDNTLVRRAGAALGHRLGSILDQVQQHLLNFRVVANQGIELRVKIAHDFDLFKVILFP